MGYQMVKKFDDRLGILTQIMSLTDRQNFHSKYYAFIQMYLVVMIDALCLYGWVVSFGILRTGLGRQGHCFK